MLRTGDGFGTRNKCLAMNSRLADSSAVATIDAWVDGCTIDGPLTLGGDNLLVGVVEPHSVQLPPGACLDLLPGTARDGRPVTFVRCYRHDDSLNTPAGSDSVFCGWPLTRWLASAAVARDQLWEPATAAHDRTLWHARLFPAVEASADYRRWLWMLEPAAALAGDWEAWRLADRYSLAEMAELADLEAFAARRAENRCEMVRSSLRRYFRHDSGFSAAELAYVFEHAPDQAALFASIVAEARDHAGRSAQPPAREAFVVARILHSLGTALSRSADSLDGAGPPAPLADSSSLACRLPSLDQWLEPALLQWLAGQGLDSSDRSTPTQWADRARRSAFASLRRTIVTSGAETARPPRCALRRDEIVWGRIPARLDLAGGWTDTPPYALEHGGRVVNAAVLLNGQPPIQVYGRVTAQPLIRLRSIDVGSDLEIRCWQQLLDYASATGEFSLVKAALVQSGFSPQAAGGPCCTTLEEALAAFGGGLELTTLAAIPKGSGLGTSSIMGALILAVIHRMLGQDLSQNELFHGVLRLEQALTTGGGWQDQIGGAAGGVKLVTTEAGLVPEATIRYLPADILDPTLNGGCTLLYYTGITRLAKNILEEVVGRYLDRDRQAMAVLAQLRTAATHMAEAISRKDLAQFGRLVDRVWGLNKRLDPNSTTPEIEHLLQRVRPHIWGAKLLGAGGGGFVLLVCKSRQAADHVRENLDQNPPNDLARFFDFAVSPEGLRLSTC